MSVVTSVDPRGFHAMLQTWPDEPGVAPCRGYQMLQLGRPTRLVLAADLAAVTDRDNVLNDLRTELSPGIGELPCKGPGGFGCWAARDPAARNLLAVFASG